MPPRRKWFGWRKILTRSLGVFCLCTAGFLAVQSLFFPRDSAARMVPRDVGLPISDGQYFSSHSPLRIVLFGTSLSAPPQNWPEALAQDLAACRGAPVEIIRVTGVGQNVVWAQDHLAQVVAAAPDLVLIEFAINDADWRDGVGLSEARDRHRALLTALRRDLPRTQLILMSMSPTFGPRGWIRPRLSAHYRQYHQLAQQMNQREVAFLDLTARWWAYGHTRRAQTPELGSMRAAMGLTKDGLHPDPDRASAVITPALLRALAPECQDPGSQS